MNKLLAFGVFSVALPFGLFSGTSGPVPVATMASVPAAVNSGVGSGSSLNWSGYVATSGTFTWIVPTVASATSTTADTTWVGIGGVTGHDLIQAGTQAVTNPSGSISYEAWYETLPQTTSAIAAVTVHAGDSVTASVSETSANSNDWQISLRDNTNGESSQFTIAYSSSLSSAEWIEEMPLNGNSFVPLDNFGTVSFMNGTAVENGNAVTIASSDAAPLTMVTQGQGGGAGTLATPSALGADGESFSVTRSTLAVAPTGPSFVVQRGQVWRRNVTGVQGYMPRATSTPTTTIRVGTTGGQRGRQFFFSFSGGYGQISRILQNFRENFQVQLRTENGRQR